MSALNDDGRATEVDTPATVESVAIPLPTASESTHVDTLAAMRDAEGAELAPEFEGAELALEFSDAVCDVCLGFIRGDGTCNCPALPRVA